MRTRGSYPVTAIIVSFDRQVLVGDGAAERPRNSRSGFSRLNSARDCPSPCSAAASDFAARSATAGAAGSALRSAVCPDLSVPNRAGEAPATLATAKRITGRLERQILRITAWRLPIF